MLVHGFIEEGSMWTDLTKTLQKKYKVIVPDLPGFGNEPLPADGTTISMEYYAEYLLTILKKEKVKKLVLLGHSMGGYVALHFAEKHGQMLSGFGLINSHCFADAPEKKENRKKGIAFVKQYGVDLFVTELYNHIFHESFKRDNKKLINRLIAKAVKYNPEAVIQANRAMMNRKDKSEVLKNALVAVLLLNGKEDESAPIASTLKQASYPPVADVHFYSKCKHMSIFEKKREAAKAIADFVARCR